MWVEGESSVGVALGKCGLMEGSFGGAKEREEKVLG